MSRITNKSHPLITQDILEKLNESKIYNEEDFIRTKVIVLQGITKLRFKDICKLLVHFVRHVTIDNGLSVSNRIKENQISISSGIQSIDALLEGGFVNCKLYELSGLAGSGKTLFCYNVMVHYLMQFDNYIYYIDTKRDFNAIKFKVMLQSKQLRKEDTDKLLKRLLVVRCNTKFEVLNTFYSIKNNLDQDVNKTYMIIIDSLPAASYNTINYQRDIDLLDRMWNVMRLICTMKYVAIIVTNFISRTIQNNELTENIQGGSYSINYGAIRLRIDSGKDYKLTILNYDKLGYDYLSCQFYL